jgi:outer membrane immunogenic protein
LKKSLLASTSLGVLMLAAGAQAADLRAPIYKAPPQAPAWSWTGFYLGGTVGAVFGHTSEANDPAASLLWLSAPVAFDGTGVIGGLEAGYNWQISQLVLGLEADISWSSLNNSVMPLSATGTTTLSSRLNALGTVRGRLGWALDKALFYGTGGVAFADLKDQLTDPKNAGVGVASGSSITGWTAGGGIEYAFSSHWTGKAEYLYVAFPTRTFAHGPYAFDFTDRFDIGRVGINYKF